MGVSPTTADGHAAYPEVVTPSAGPDYVQADWAIPAEEPPAPLPSDPPQQPAVPTAGSAFIHHVEPIPDLPIRAPRVPSLPGQQILGYLLQEPRISCDCDLRLEGIIAIIVLLVFVFPVAWIPLVIPDCYQRYQVPVYGFPLEGADVPIAEPFTVPASGLSSAEQPPSTIVVE